MIKLELYPLQDKMKDFQMWERHFVLRRVAKEKKLFLLNQWIAPFYLKNLTF
jgi:hypothetical protein